MKTTCPCDGSCRPALAARRRFFALERSPAYHDIRASVARWSGVYFPRELREAWARCALRARSEYHPGPCRLLRARALFHAGGAR